MPVGPTSRQLNQSNRFGRGPRRCPHFPYLLAVHSDRRRSDFLGPGNAPGFTRPVHLLVLPALRIRADLGRPPPPVRLLPAGLFLDALISAARPESSSSPRRSLAGDTWVERLARAGRHSGVALPAARLRRLASRGAARSAGTDSRRRLRIGQAISPSFARRSLAVHRRGPLYR